MPPRLIWRGVHGWLQRASDAVFRDKLEPAPAARRDLDANEKKRHLVSYKPIEVNRNSLTIMGVPFPDRESFNRACSGIGTNMFEGYVPTRKQVEYIRDIVMGKMTVEQIIALPIAEEYEDEREDR
jgi:hypothetical protein